MIFRAFWHVPGGGCGDFQFFRHFFNGHFPDVASINSRSSRDQRLRLHFMSAPFSTAEARAVMPEYAAAITDRFQGKRGITAARPAFCH